MIPPLQQTVCELSVLTVRVSHRLTPTPLLTPLSCLLSAVFNLLTFGLGCLFFHYSSLASRPSPLSFSPLSTPFLWFLSEPQGIQTVA